MTTVNKDKDAVEGAYEDLGQDVASLTSAYLDLGSANASLEAKLASLSKIRGTALRIADDVSLRLDGLRSAWIVSCDSGGLIQAKPTLHLSHEDAMVGLVDMVILVFGCYGCVDDSDREALLELKLDDPDEMMKLMSRRHGCIMLNAPSVMVTMVRLS